MNHRRPSAIFLALALAMTLSACGERDDNARQAAALQAKARAERAAAAQAEASQAAAEAQALSVEGAADKVAALKASAAALTDDGAKLEAGVTAAPDFGAQAVGQSAQLDKLTGEPSQRLAQANRIVLATTQIDVARGRYATGLNPLMSAGEGVDEDVRRFCASPAAAALGAPCADALAAATAFEQAQVHAAVVFKAYKQTVYDELQRQGDAVAKLGG